MRSIKDKILSYTILSVVVISIVFTIFIGGILNKILKQDIIKEMDYFKSFSINVLKKNEVMEVPIWKTLSSINDTSSSYVAISSKEDIINQFTGTPFNKDEINEVLSQSNKEKSLIKFNKENSVYFVTYNYPIYMNNEYYGNLIIQKDYNDKYNEKFKLMGIVILGQILVVISLIIILSIVLKKVITPLKRITKSMDEFSKGNEEEDINISTNDEVEELGNSYNIMKNKIQTQMNIIVEEKEKVQKLQKSSREFFNSATHELKTPITSISTYAQVLRDNDISNMDKEFINRATERMVLECNKMKSLVEKILEVSKGNTINSKSKVEINLEKLIEEIIDDFHLRIEKKNLTINKSLSPIIYKGNLEDIEQILVNLIDNSIKYTTGEEVSLSLIKSNMGILFTIKNKCGNFPKDIMDRLLEPFIKYNSNHNNKEISSSGVGLYVCSELSKINGGELTYKIQENEIIFTLNLN